MHVCAGPVSDQTRPGLIAAFVIIGVTGFGILIFAGIICCWIIKKYCCSKYE